MTATFAIREFGGDHEHGPQGEEVSHFAIAFDDQSCVYALTGHGPDVFRSMTTGDWAAIESLNEEMEEWFVRECHGGLLMKCPEQPNVIHKFGAAPEFGHQILLEVAYRLTCGVSAPC